MTHIEKIGVELRWELKKKQKYKVFHLGEPTTTQLYYLPI